MSKKILVCGGFKSDIPQWMFDNFSISHIERKAVVEANYSPDLVLVFIRFASHNLKEIAENIAKAAQVPLLFATNYSDAIKLAQRHSIDWFFETAIAARSKK